MRFIVLCVITVGIHSWMRSRKLVVPNVTGQHTVRVSGVETISRFSFQNLAPSKISWNMIWSVHLLEVPLNALHSKMEWLLIASDFWCKSSWILVASLTLFSKCILARYLEQQQSVTRSGDQTLPSVIHTTSSDVLSMKTNRDRFDSDWLECITSTAQDILDLLPPKFQLLTVDELINFACISDTNSFGISIDQHSDDDLSSACRPNLISLFVGGLGLYRMCAKLNHSCYPTCQFSLASSDQGSGAPLVMRTSRPVGPNEELTDSYVDLYTNR